MGREEDGICDGLGWSCMSEDNLDGILGKLESWKMKDGLEMLGGCQDGG